MHAQGLILLTMKKYNEHFLFELKSFKRMQISILLKKDKNPIKLKSNFFSDSKFIMSI